ncbi:EGF and laminin G domain-containing protein [Nematostella vectensis]|uniref:EGF and laminin G domain-containing protein n=1 Tax=Nematostella vectensis TaxID=45351 RepID=UPI00207772BD|nr:EGF and laminin G domain-containing protein [Nematostella vectensis]
MIARSLVTIFLLLFCFRYSLAAIDTEGYFDGNAYAEYLLHDQDEKIDSPKNTIELQFRTIQPNGLLLHGSSSGEEYGDYFTIELIGGKLRFAISLGRRQGIDDMVNMTLGDGLADNKFHTVLIEHNNREVWLFLDQLTRDDKRRRIETRYKQLTLDEFFFIGGAHDMKRIRDVISGANFQGCLKGVRVNGKNILQALSGDATTLRKYDVKETCDDEVSFEPMTLNGRLGQFSIGTQTAINKFRGKLSFRTYKSSGTVLSMNERFFLNFTTESISLVVLIGKSLTLVSQRQMFQYAPLNTGMWHHVEFEIGPIAVWINVDKMVDMRPPSADLPQNFFIGSVQIGGDFVGCVLNIELNGVKFDPKSLSPTEYIEVGTCHITDFCFPTVCQHGSKCIQDGKTFGCDCLNTHYKGSVCQFSQYYRTCYELQLEYPELETGNYTIDPDGSGPEEPYQTICNITTELDWFGDEISRVWTEVLTEDWNVLLQKYPPEEAQKPESVIRDIMYKPTFLSAQMVAMASEYCKQFVEYLCTGSRLLNSLNPAYGHWVGSHGRHYYYWGGSGPQYPGKCACGVRGDCLDNKGCNCDARRSTLESDEGYLFGSNGQILPVSQVLFGDVDIDSDHYANYTVGPLLCYGRPNNTATFSREDGIISLRYREGSLDGEYGDVSLFFRTPYTRGILFHQGEKTRNTRDFIQVNITSNDTVQLSYDIGNGPQSIVVQVTENPLNTNRLWHKVVVWFNIKEFGLEVDGIRKIRLNPLQQSKQLDVVGNLFIGGYMREMMNGFVGCIRGFTINGEVLNLARLSKDFDYVNEGCYSACNNETQCKGGARCTDDYNIYKCDCHLTPFYGYFCEQDLGAAFKETDSYLRYTFPEGERDAWGTDFAVGFKTGQCSGTIMEMTSHTQGHYFRISIQDDNKLIFKYNTAAGDGGKEILPPKGKSFCDNERHTFSMERKKDLLIYRVDGGPEMRDSGERLTKPFERPKQLLIGATGEGRFEGCISGVKITNWPTEKIMGPTIEPIKQLLYDNDDTNIVAKGVSKSKCGQWYDVPSVPTRPIPGPHGAATPPPGPPGGPEERRWRVDDEYTAIIVIIVLLVVLCIVAALVLVYWYYTKRKGVYHTYEDEPLAKNNEPFISLQPMGGEEPKPKKEWYI